METNNLSVVYNGGIGGIGGTYNDETYILTSFDNVDAFYPNKQETEIIYEELSKENNKNNNSNSENKSNIYPYDETIDVWCVGLIFYELLMGNNIGELIGETESNYKHFFTGDYIEIMHSNFMMKDLPEFYWKLISSMISKNPQDRPTSKNVYDAMKKYANATGIIIAPQNMKYCFSNTVKNNFEIMNKLSKKWNNNFEQLYKKMTTICSKICNIPNISNKLCNFDFSRIIKYLIICKEINDENIEIICISICVIINTWIFDDIVFLDEIVSKCKKEGLLSGEKDILIIQITKNMFYIIKEYGLKLFVNCK